KESFKSVGVNSLIKLQNECRIVPKKHLVKHYPLETNQNKKPKQKTTPIVPKQTIYCLLNNDERQKKNPDNYFLKT
ncbi:hypothetical protein NPN23_23830, partial [Vibrio parahaemolyticus]|nr:hypothetical protein [Vibrio parahaemolyticus]